MMENYSYGPLFKLENNSKMTVVNSVFDDGLGLTWSQYPIWLEGGSDFLAINSTFKQIESNNDDAAIYVSGSGSDILLFNTIIDAKEVLYHSGSNNTLEIINSLIPSSADLTYSGLTVIIDSTDVIFGAAQINADYSLPPTSPAIGLGKSSHLWKGNAYFAPLDDIYGKNRPIPTGSSVDVGAVESDKAIGEFDFNITTCGNFLDVGVLNTNSYSVSISGPANFAASNTTGLSLNVLGQYAVSVYDSLSQVTLTKTISYNNPLSIGYLWSRNACASNAGYGEIVFGDFTGGVDISPSEQWFDYYIDLTDTSGTYSNRWQVHQGSGSNWNANVQSGQYIVELSDGSGCSVYDTVDIEDIQGSKYYISTTGSDANTGVYADPLATIQEALNRACDGDTIVLFDGEYFENVELTSTYLPYVTIASEYIEDGLVSHISNTIVNGMDEDPVFDISNQNSTTDTIVFVGFTITNGKSSNWYGGGGISTNYSNIALKHMRVSGNRSGHSGGGIGMDGGYLNLWNTVIENNIASGEGGGIRANYMYRIDGHGSTIIQNNKSNSNGGGISYGHGHWGSTNEDFYIRGFEIVNNSADGTGGLHVSNWGNNNGTLEIDNIKVVNNRSTSYVTGL